MTKICDVSNLFILVFENEKSFFVLLFSPPPYWFSARTGPRALIKYLTLRTHLSPKFIHHPANIYQVPAAYQTQEHT